MDKPTDHCLEPKLLPLGDTAWTIEFGNLIAPELHARVQGFLDALEKANGQPQFDGIVDLVPTFRSLTVHYDPFLCNGEDLGQALITLAKITEPLSQEGRHWTLPICFEGDFAPDLDDLAQTKAMHRNDVIDLLCRTSFRVYMIGFMPGFPYMGGLPEALEMPRLASPRKAVPARSLAVAGTMCAVYPWESPGGWRLLGRTPIPMFDAANNTSPSLLASGDRVSWRKVSPEEYAALEHAVANGHLSRQSLLSAEGTA